jgi:mannose-6-phosphate isomerase-like protein (cupin superfamily)
MPILKFSEFSATMQGSGVLLSAAADGKTNLMPQASVSYCLMKPGEETKPHTHDRVEMYLILSGRGQAMAGDTISEVTTGDVVIAPIGTPHALKVIGSETLRYYAFNSPPVSTCPMVPAAEEVLWRWNQSR